MHFSIDRSTLLSVLTHLQAVVERRTTLPILSNILLEATEGKLLFQATDLDIELSEEVQAQVFAPGKTTVPVFLFYEIVRKLPEGVVLDVKESSEGNFLEIKADRARYSLQTLPWGEFPDFSQGVFEHHFEISSSLLKTLLDRVRIAIANEEVRYYLNGIYLHTVMEGETPLLRSVSADGHRLALVDVPCPEGAFSIPGVIIPKKTVFELSKLLEACKEDVSVALSATKVRFAFKNSVLTSKLINATFPDYTKVIPKDNTKIMTVETKDLAKAVDRVATLISDKNHGIRLSLSPSAPLLVSLAGTETAFAEEEIAAAYGDASFDIVFNPRYLLDILGQLKTEVAICSFNDPLSPMIVREGGVEDALYVLMPMRL